MKIYPGWYQIFKETFNVIFLCILCSLECAAWKFSRMNYILDLDVTVIIFHFHLLRECYTWHFVEHLKSHAVRFELTILFITKSKTPQYQRPKNCVLQIPYHHSFPRLWQMLMKNISDTKTGHTILKLRNSQWKLNKKKAFSVQILTIYKYINTGGPGHRCK